MNIIVNWIMNAIIGSFSGPFSILGSVTYSLFDDALFTSLFTIAKTIGYSLYIIAIMILVTNTMKRVADGEGFNFMDLIFRIVLGAVLLTWGVDFFLLIYKFILDFANKVLALIAGYSFTTDNITISLDTLPTLLALIMLVIAIFFLVKTAFSLGERFWYMFGTLILMYAYLFQYVLGNDEAMSSWIKQVLAISLTQLFQSLFVTAALNIFVTSPDIGMFFISLCGIVASSNIEKILDKFAMSSGGKIGNTIRNAMSSVFYVNQLKRTIPIK